MQNNERWSYIISLIINNKNGILVNSEQNPEECDPANNQYIYAAGQAATDDASNTTAGYIKIS
jgi:hypothetical protein